MITVYTYRVKAHAPDPRREGSFFTYDDTVDRDSALSNGNQFNLLVNGLVDYFQAQTGVRVSPEGLVIEDVELLGSREDTHFPAPGLRK